MFLASPPCKKDFKSGMVLVCSILGFCHSSLLTSVCLDLQGPLNCDVCSSWLLDQDSQMIVPGSSSLWKNGQMMVVGAFCQSFLCSRQNKWFHVFSLISLVFNGVLCARHSLRHRGTWSWWGQFLATALKQFQLRDFLPLDLIRQCVFYLFYMYI